MTSPSRPNLIADRRSCIDDERSASSDLSQSVRHGFSERRTHGASFLVGLCVLGAALLGLMGCVGSFERIDSRVADIARDGIGSGWEPVQLAGGKWGTTVAQRDDRRDYDYLEFDVERRAREEEEEENASGKSVILGEMLAIFPGLLWHGVGHYYAGDYQSSRRIRSIGEWGYLLTAIGGGLLVGAIALDDSSDDILPVSLYVSGGAFAAIGLGYFFTAWGADIYDTPRAIRENGRPWDWLADDEIFDD